MAAAPKLTPVSDDPPARARRGPAERATRDDRDGRALRNDRSPTALTSADPARNFSLTVDERIRALTIGVPSWAARKRKIEDDEERLVGELVQLHDALATENRAADEIELSLLAAAAAFDLTKLNELVRSHNRYYPIEANLPMDRRGNYLAYGRVWSPEEPYSAARLVALARTYIEERAQRELEESDD